MFRRGFPGRLMTAALLMTGMIVMVAAAALIAARSHIPQTHWLVIRTLEDNRFNFYRLHPDRSDLQQINSLPPNAIDMNWSPDGAWIAYLGLDENHTTQLYRMRPGGSHQQQLTDAPNDIGTIEWSPDSRQIIYTTFNEPELEAYVMNADGSNQRLLDGLPGWAFRIRWSPDGSWLLFASDYEGEFDVYRMRLDGSDLQNITHSSSVDDIADWSPDGSGIVFVSLRASWLGQIYRLSFADGRARRLTNTETRYADVKYSPDGDWIAFSAHFGSSSGVFLIRPDGTGIQQITDGKTLNTFSQWFPIVDLPVRAWLLLSGGVVMALIGLWGLYVL